MPTSSFDSPLTGPTPPSEMRWPSGTRAMDAPIPDVVYINVPVYVPTPMLFFVMRAFHTVFPTGHVYWTVPTAPDGGGLLAPFPAIELADIVVFRTIEGGSGSADPYRAAFLQVP